MYKEPRPFKLHEALSIAPVPLGVLLVGARALRLSGPLGIQNESRHISALHSVALRFPGFGGVLQENRATPPKKGPVAPSFFELYGWVLGWVSWAILRHEASDVEGVRRRPVPTPSHGKHAIYQAPFFQKSLRALLLGSPPSSCLGPVEA